MISKPHLGDGFRLFLVGLTATILGVVAGCQTSKQEEPRAAWISELLDVSYEMSMHFVRIATDRDAVVDGKGDVVGNCDPKESASTYDEVSRRLSHLLRDASSIGIDEQHQPELEKILEDWSSIQRKHVSLWNETTELQGIDASDRCLRVSAIIEFILSIEKNIRAVAREGLTVPN